MDIENLVSRLIAQQFPEFGHLTLQPILPGGCDNRTFCLVEDYIVRLPSRAKYTPQVDKEQRWLPYLAQELPLMIPEPIGCGALI